MKIINIPKEVYLAAIDYEGYNRPDDLEKAEEWYKIDSAKAGFTHSGLDKAICDYILRNGLFADGEEFEDIDGFIY